MRLVPLDDAVAVLVDVHSDVGGVRVVVVVDVFLRGPGERERQSVDEERRGIAVRVPPPGLSFPAA